MVSPTIDASRHVRARVLVVMLLLSTGQAFREVSTVFGQMVKLTTSEALSDKRNEWGNLETSFPRHYMSGDRRGS